MGNFTFKDNGDYTFLKFDKLIIREQSVIQSLFNGSTIGNCQFFDTNFSRCDIEGALVHNSSFETVNFETADFRSNHIGKTKFIACDFSDSFIINTEFCDCDFFKCNFSSAIIDNCTFLNCSFSNCITQKGTFTFLDFNNTTFKDLSWGNCSFYKNIIDKCDFDNVWINIDSLGQLFGLNNSIINQLNYIFLGQKLGRITNELYTSLPKIYTEKGWSFDYIFLQYNMGELSTYEMLLNVNSYFIDSISSKKIIKKDDLQFITQVLDKLHIKNMLPLFAVLESIIMLNSGIKEFAQTLSISILNDLKKYIFHLVQLAQEMSDKFFDEATSQNYGLNKMVKISLRYEAPQPIDWAKQVNNIFEGYRVFLPQNATLLRIEQGSYIEIILIALGSVFALQFLLFGINGIILQLLDMKAGITTLAKKSAPQSYVDRILAGKQVQPEAYKDMVEIIKDERKMKKILKLAKKTKDVSILSGTAEIIEEQLDTTE